MAVNITSGASLQRMENSIYQANQALNHSIEPDIKDEWQRLTAAMYSCRKRAIEKNEEWEKIKNDTTPASK